MPCVECTSVLPFEDKKGMRQGRGVLEKCSFFSFGLVLQVLYLRYCLTCRTAVAVNIWFVLCLCLFFFSPVCLGIMFIVADFHAGNWNLWPHRCAVNVSTIATSFPNSQPSVLVA